MRAEVYSKPATDPYSAIAIASLLPVPLPQVHVANPTADADPNVSGLLPTNARVLAFPQYGQRFFASCAVSILAGTSLIGRPWWYDTPSGKWLPSGNLVTATVAPAGTSGTVSFIGPRTKRFFFQVTTVNGAVTDLTYGFIT